MYFLNSFLYKKILELLNYLYIFNCRQIIIVLAEPPLSYLPFLKETIICIIKYNKLI